MKLHLSMRRQCVRRVLCALMVVTVAGLRGVAHAGQTFDQQCQKVSASIETQPEQAIRSLLENGLAAKKPAKAFAIARKWLGENEVKDPQLLYEAGHAAELSCDWRSAVDLYRQYLKRADLKSENASKAAQGVYAIEIEDLGKPDAAYAYSRSSGNRLVVIPSARQYDQWFLDRAIKQGDRHAVASRLLALLNAKVPTDLLTSIYGKYFHWLLRDIEASHLRSDHFTKSFVQDVKTLASEITFDNELKLRLSWDVSVFSYNQALYQGKTAKAPIDQAKALLQAYPQYALKVQTDWFGGVDSQLWQVDVRKFWSKDTQAKEAAVQSVMDKLSPLDRADLLASWKGDQYSHGAHVLSPKASRAYVLAHPNAFDGRIQVSWPQLLDGLDYEQAQKLAPLLGHSALPQASVIRAMVAGGKRKDLDKMVAALIGPGAWRLNESQCDQAVKYLWDWAGRPGGTKSRKAAEKKVKSAYALIDANQVKATSSAATRMAAFKKLQDNFWSASPKGPALRSRLMHVVEMTPEALPVLLNDQHAAAQQMARDALDDGITGQGKVWKVYESWATLSTDHYSPSIMQMANHYRGLSSLKRRYPSRYKPHPLERVLRKEVSRRLKAGDVKDGWLVLAWLNSLFPEEDAGAGQLAVKLHDAKVWQHLPYEARWGARQRFGSRLHNKQEQEDLAAANPTNVFKALLTLPEKADASAASAALKDVISRYELSPVRLDFQGLDRLGHLSSKVFKDPKVLQQVMTILGPLHVMVLNRDFGSKLYDVATNQQRPELIYPSAAYLWKLTYWYHNKADKLIQYTAALAEKYPAAADAFARAGLYILPQKSRHGDDARMANLKSIRGKTAMAMGLMVIPVSKDNPAYPIYKSQGEYSVGNEEGALELYEANANQLLPVCRNLSASYVLWLLRQSIETQNQQNQEALAKALRAWEKDMPGAFSVDQKIDLDLAFGDIAVQKGMLPEAAKIFQGIAKNKAYQSSLHRFDATLRLVMVDRMSHNYDAALQTLDELESQKIPSLTLKAKLARAEVYYDTKDYAQAAKQINTVLDEDPNNADGRILLGRVQLKRQQLIEATEIEIGNASSQKTLVPGEPLKVTLNDPTLEVSAGGSAIEVAVKTTSGDKEYVLLHQFGDEKTKYRGTLKTALGKAVVNDGTLEVVGDDKVYYEFSKRYREKVGHLSAHRQGPITIISDAMLMASARKLLTVNEQRVADMNAVAEANGNGSIASLKNMDPAQLQQLRIEAAGRRRKAMLQTRVKPGSPIHLRVVDPDASLTGGIDTVNVSARTSSGDRVDRITLKETGDYTGHFEGELPTATAEAQAYASSSQTGRNANMVISPKLDYPAWAPVTSGDELPQFTVDLNANASLGTLGIETKSSDHRLDHFAVQTSMNGKQWTTVGVYPNDKLTVKHPWQPSVTVVEDSDNYQMHGRTSINPIDDVRKQLDFGYLSQRWSQGLAENVKGPSDAMPESIVTAIDWKRHGHWPNTHVVYRFRSYFYEPAKITRRFQLILGKTKPVKHGSKSKKMTPQFLLVVDGRPITKPQMNGQLEGDVTLAPGVHTFEIWAIGWVQTTMGFGRSTTLKTNVNGGDKLSNCPDSFFDPNTFPKGVLEHRNTPGQLTAGDQDKTFKLKFADGSRARFIRLVMGKKTGHVPYLNHLTLTTPEGKKLLPVAYGYAELRKNNVLEILPGDRIAVQYVDDRFVTKSDQKLTRSLNAGYTNGRIEFADINPRPNRSGNMAPYHEELLRFAYGKPLPIVIYDADMDVTTKPDKVLCILTSKTGGVRHLTAVETGDSTGTFRVMVTPVAVATKKEDEIQVDPGGTLRATYRDKENLDPGVACDRHASITQAAFTTPRIEMGDMSVKPVDPSKSGPSQPLFSSFNPAVLQRGDQAKMVEQLMPTYYQLTRHITDMEHASDGEIDVVDGRYALIEIVAPQLAMRPTSTVTVYAQTDSGRALASDAKGNGNKSQVYDIDVPGTMKIFASLDPSLPRSLVPVRSGYVLPNNYLPDATNLSSYWKSGRFVAWLPLVSGVLPRESFATDSSKKTIATPKPVGLVVKVGEKIHIGLRYKDSKGHFHWATCQAKVISRPMLDVMDASYRHAVTNAYLGDTLHIRVADLSGDKTDARDSVEVALSSTSAHKKQFKLQETAIHSGIFQGDCQLTYAASSNGTKVTEQSSAKGDAEQSSFAVAYGDTVNIGYTDDHGHKTVVHQIAVARGADGAITVFSKKYTDPKIASKTLFALANSYLELARRRRAMHHDEQAKREFATAKQLLETTISRLNDRQSQAHAQYLLGMMAMEDALSTKDPTLQEERYHAALARMMKVTEVFTDTQYAADAQFRIAELYEKMHEPDIAAQEYVKLAYKYPQSPHISTAMARLGTHFQSKAMAYEKQSTSLAGKKEDKDAQAKAGAFKKLSQQEYVKAAQIFVKLQSRFPDDVLAGKAGLRAGEIYLRTQDYQKAINALLRVIQNKNYDGATIRSAAMFWAGRSYASLREPLKAYSIYKRITYDFPETKWAAYARSELSADNYQRLERTLEMKRLESKR